MTCRNTILIISIAFLTAALSVQARVPEGTRAENDTTLTIELPAGWSLISSNLDFSDDYIGENGPDMQLILQDIIDQILIIKNASEFSVPSSNFRQLRTWDTSQGYLICVSEDTELVVHGRPIPYDRPIDLFCGWNFIAYYPDYELFLSAALRCLTDRGLLLDAKDGQGRSYSPRQEWWGWNAVIEPGSGLQINVTESCQLIYPEEDTFVERPPEANLRHFPDVPPTFDSMSILFNAITGLDVVDGAEMACFTPGGIIAGATVIEGDPPYGMPAWPDDSFTADVVEGFLDGEAIHLLYWDPIHDWELEMSTEVIEGDGLIFHTNDYITIDVALGVDEDKPDPQPFDFRLDGVYPNPFNSTARIEFSLQRRTDVHLTVYDLAGRRVVSLVDATLEAGKHFATLNGDFLQSGIYMVALESGNRQQVKRALLIK